MNIFYKFAIEHPPEAFIITALVGVLLAFWGWRRKEYIKIDKENKTLAQKSKQPDEKLVQLEKKLQERKQANTHTNAPSRTSLTDD